MPRAVSIPKIAGELVALFWALLVSLIATWAAVRWGFFKKLKSPTRTLPQGRQVLIAFVLFIAVLWGATAVSLIWGSGLGTPLIGLLGVLVAAILVGSYALRATPVWHYLAADSFRQMAGYWLRGLLCLLVAFPWVIVVSKICTTLDLWWFGDTGPGQSVVRYLEGLRGHPMLIGVSAILVVIVAPWLEELLFRGLLQSWLRRYLAPCWAITIATAVFALCHYSPTQGIGNFEIVLSLAVLGAFLGYLLEKYETLWAPIGLHMAFNAVGSALALWGENGT